MNAPIKIGILGMGRAGGSMISAEAAKRPEKFTIAAICDECEEQSAPYKEKFSCKSYTDEKELFADKELELLVIATPSKLHVKNALEALKTGKHVFLEKPIALTYQDALKLEKAAKKSKGKLLLRHNRRFEPAFQHIREIIASGILGEVFEVKLRRNAYQRRNDWQTLIECGGGQLNNWGPHIIDHSLRFLDSPLKELWSDLKLVAAVGDAEDHLKIVMKGENGRIVDMEISGGAAITEPEYIIFGKKGALSCDGKNITLRYIDPEVKLPAVKVIKGIPKGFNSEKLPWIEKTIPVAPEAKCDTDSIWDYIYETLRNGKEFPITFEQALEVVRVTTEVKKKSEFKNK